MQPIKSFIKKSIKVLIVIEIGWLLIGNLLLNTSLGPRLANLKPEKFTMSWESGWTPYPASVSIKNIAIDIHTFSTDIAVSADTASAKIGLLPLLSKRLLIDDLKGGNANITVIREKPSTSRPAPAKPYPGFTIDLRNASVNKIEKFIFNRLTVSGGETAARGSVQMQIRGDKIIEDVDATWTNASFQIDQRAFTKTVSASFKGGMSAFNPRIDKGLELVKKITALVTLDGVVGSLAPLKLFFPGAEWIEEINGEGRVAIDANIVDGKLQEGTLIDIDADRLKLDFLGFRAEGSGRVDGSVKSIDQARKAKLELLFDQFELSRRRVSTPLIFGAGLKLTALAPDLGVIDDVSDLVITLELPDSRVPDITVLDDYLPPALDISVTDGSATIKGEIKVAGPDQLATGELHITGDDLRGKFRDLEFQVDMSIDSPMSGEQLDDFQLGLSGMQFKLFNGIFENETVEVDKQWWMSVEVPDGNVILADPLELDADIDLAMKDTRAIVALFSEVKEWISRFDGMLTVEDVAGQANIHASEKKLSVRNLEIQGDRLDLVAELRADDGQNDAIVWGKLGIFSMGLERIGEESNWKLINGKEWFEQKKAENWQ